MNKKNHIQKVAEEKFNLGIVQMSQTKKNAQKNFNPMIYKSVVINNTSGNMPGISANFDNNINTTSRVTNIQRSSEKNLKKSDAITKKKFSLAMNNYSSYKHSVNQQDIDDTIQNVNIYSVGYKDQMDKLEKGSSYNFVKKSYNLKKDTLYDHSKINLQNKEVLDISDNVTNNLNGKNDTDPSGKNEKRSSFQSTVLKKHLGFNKDLKNVKEAEIRKQVNSKFEGKYTKGYIKQFEPDKVKEIMKRSTQRKTVIKPMIFNDQ